jgi:hypothetical protein
MIILRKRLRTSRIMIACVALVATTGIAYGDPAITGDVIVASFSNPALSGNIIPLAGQQSYFDNSSTAVYSIYNSSDPTTSGTPPVQSTGSQLNWGAGDFPDPNFSNLTFFGRPVPANASVPFDLGFLRYTNGTSDLSSLIFGGTLTFYATNDGTNLIPIGSTFINIVTTSNLSVAGSEAHDADFISLSGIANKTFNVYEGATAGAEIYGYITGDPQLTLTDIVLAPGQSANGFIGNGQPASLPEPSPLFLGLIAALGSTAFAWTRRNRRDV